MIFADATGTASFADITALCQRSEFITNDEKIYAVTLTGQNARRDYEKLKAISVYEQNLLDGQVIENESGGRLARVRGTAKLVRITSTEFNTGQGSNSEALSIDGVITNLAHNVRQGFNTQQCTFTVHVCTKIHSVSAGALVTLESS